MEVSGHGVGGWLYPTACLHAERKMMDSVRLFMRLTLLGNHRHSRRSALMKTGWENTW